MGTFDKFWHHFENCFRQIGLDFILYFAVTWPYQPIFDILKNSDLLHKVGRRKHFYPFPQINAGRIRGSIYHKRHNYTLTCSYWCLILYTTFCKRYILFKIEFPSKEKPPNCIIPTTKMHVSLNYIYIFFKSIYITLTLSDC